MCGVNVLTRAESVKGTFPFNIHELSVLSAQKQIYIAAFTWHWRNQIYSHTHAYTPRTEVPMCAVVLCLGVHVSERLRSQVWEFRWEFVKG